MKTLNTKNSNIPKDKEITTTPSRPLRSFTARDFYYYKKIIFESGKNDIPFLQKKQ